MPLHPRAIQEGSFTESQLAQIATGIIEDETCGFPRSPYAEGVRVEADRPPLPGRLANYSSRAIALKLKTALARGWRVRS
jgi:hypothetical protein